MTYQSQTLPSEKSAVHGVRWGWLLALGILLTVLGIIGLGMTYSLTMAAMFWFGALAIIAGVAQVVDAFHHKGWKSFIWHVLIGIVYVIAGLMMIFIPVSAAFWLTVFLAISLVATGVMRIVMAFMGRGQGGWLVVVLSGVISIILGVMIYGMVVPPTPEALATPEGQAAWLQSWGWVIGLFVAVELIMEGLAQIVIALGVRKIQGTQTTRA